MKDQNKKKKKVRKKKSSPKIDIKRISIEDISAGFEKLKNKVILSSFLKHMKKLRIGGLSGGNHVVPIVDGDRCFDLFIEAIKSAKFSINLETYIFNSDDVGWKFAHLLVEKAKNGVEVNLIYDAIGCIATTPGIFSFMREGGVEILEYHPILPWRKNWNPGLRDHRKILAVDGRVAFLGGINIGKEYAGEAYMGGNWRDSHLMIEGPAVKDVQYFFMENWYRNGGPMMNQESHFREVKRKGDHLVMILSSKARKNIRPIKESYLSAIDNAEKSIYITNAYFVPTHKLYRTLIHAARRGIDVRLLLPAKSDLPIVKYASRYLYKKYLKNGIRVYEYTRSVLHAKTAVIDGVWSTIGSTNLDGHGFRRNLEINAVILDENIGKEMEEIFSNDMEFAQELLSEKWEKRSFVNYIIEWFCYRFRRIL